jgi:hypothetical protein
MNEQFSEKFKAVEQVLARVQACMPIAKPAKAFVSTCMARFKPRAKTSWLSDQ